MQRKLILIKRDLTAKCWVATHYVIQSPIPTMAAIEELCNPALDPEISELFGAATLPTAFTLHADVQTVLDTLRRLNPDAIVEHC